MGGIHLYESDNKPLHPLSRSLVMKMVQDQTIELPTDAEIRGMSKSNPLAKAIVLVQVGWFAIDCITRVSQSFSMTKLEIATITYIMTHAFTYIAWWDKPQGVKRPIRVTIGQVGRPAPSTVEVKKFYWLLKALVFLYGTREDYIDLTKRRQVPLCYSGHPAGNWPFASASIAILVAALSEGIYCIAWSYPTSSFTELVLWRIASLPLAAALLSVIAAFSAGGCIYPMLNDEKRYEPYFRVLEFCYFLVTIFFIISRPVLLALALMDLRALSDSTAQAVYWTTLLPHL